MLRGLAPSAARAQGIDDHYEGYPLPNRREVGNFTTDMPVVAGTYRIDLVGSGDYRLTIYTRKP